MVLCRFPWSHICRYSQPRASYLAVFVRCVPVWDGPVEPPGGTSPGRLGRGGNAFGERWTWEQTGTGYALSLFDLTMTVEGDTMTFVIPERYEGCDGYVLATVR